MRIGRTLPPAAAPFGTVEDDNTLCVIAHHLFGVPSDVARTRALCHRRHVVVVEDAAQGLSVMSKGEPAGTTMLAASPAEKRDLLGRSHRLGLGLSGGYRVAVDQIPELQRWSTREACPHAHRIADHLRTIPVHHWLSTRDWRAICECVRAGGPLPANGQSSS
jgi:dTDP-4-amino-4,6-dideoxygalactose transaminase